MLSSSESILISVSVMCILFILSPFSWFNTTYGQFVVYISLVVALLLLMMIRSQHRQQTKKEMEAKGVDVQRAMIFAYIVGVIIVVWVYREWWRPGANEQKATWLILLALAFLVVHFWWQWVRK